MHHSNVASLVSLEKVCHSTLQTAADEDAVVDVIEEDGSESVNVTCSTEGETPVRLFIGLTRSSCVFQDIQGRTLQHGQIALGQAGKGLIAGREQSEISLLLQHIHEVCGFHQRQKDPAYEEEKEKL